MRGRGREDDRGREASVFCSWPKNARAFCFLWRCGDKDEMEGFASLCRLAELGFCVFGFLLFFLEVGDEDWFGLGFLQTQKKGS
jgi:hypothetical protein